MRDADTRLAMKKTGCGAQKRSVTHSSLVSHRLPRGTTRRKETWWKKVFELGPSGSLPNSARRRQPFEERVPRAPSSYSLSLAGENPRFENRPTSKEK